MDLDFFLTVARVGVVLAPSGFSVRVLLPIILRYVQTWARPDGRLFVDAAYP